MVVRGGSSRGGSVSGPLFPGSDVLVRRVRPGLGSQSGVGHLVSGGEALVNKCQGASGRGEGSSGLSRPDSRFVGCSVLGQHDCVGLPQETGGDICPAPQLLGAEGSQVGRKRTDLSLSPVHSGEKECGGRCAFQTEPSSGFGMDAPPRGVQRLAQEVACDNRLVRKFTKSSLRCLFCHNLGSHGCGGGCNAAVLGLSSGIRIPPVCHGEASSQQVESFAGGGLDPDCSSVVPEGMVSGPSGVDTGASGTASRSLGFAASASCQEVSQQSVKASSSCVETIKRFARAAGFSAEVARRLTKSRRSSSLRVYQSKWSLYRRWCWDKGHSVSNPSIPKVADFLLWLWRSKGLSLSAIKGYRAMLSAVFKFSLPELSDHHVIRSLLRSFSIERPRVSSSPPSWDLDLVLRHLMSEAYEPLSSQSLRSLTKKTLFLVALATARRVGELQALSRVVSTHGDDFVLSYMPHFLAKTERADRPLPRSFTLRSLRDFAGDLEEGCALCPVRALRVYLERTKGVVSRGAGLFVSPSCPTRSISKNAISFFLREVISGAGAIRGAEGPPLRAHSIRGMASSASFFQNWSVTKVLEAGCWKSNSVFASFYLKDILFEFEGWKSLGPFVAASTVVHP